MRFINQTIRIQVTHFIKRLDYLASVLGMIAKPRGPHCLTFQRFTDIRIAFV